MSEIFVDSNIVIYAYSADDRAGRAQQILTLSPTISVQTLNEFANVARRKLKLEWSAIASVIDGLSVLCPLIVELSVDVHMMARAVAERYQVQFFDALIIAAALYAECDTLYSEDMHDGLVIENRLTIRNPFV